jgi:hypothetical protein
MLFPLSFLMTRVAVRAPPARTRVALTSIESCKAGLAGISPKSANLIPGKMFWTVGPDVEAAEHPLPMSRTAANPIPAFHRTVGAYVGVASHVEKSAPKHRICVPI